MSVEDETYDNYIPAGEGDVGRRTSPRTFGTEVDHTLQLGLTERLRGTWQVAGDTPGLEAYCAGQGRRSRQGPCAGAVELHAEQGAADRGQLRALVRYRQPDSTAWHERLPLRGELYQSGSQTCLIWTERQQYQIAAGYDAYCPRRESRHA